MQSGAYVAIDVGASKIAGALVVYEGQGQPPCVMGRLAVPTEPRRGGQAVLATVLEVAERIARSAHVAVAGAGVASAGVVDPGTGRIRHATAALPGWEGQPLRESLEEALCVPAAALGDVQAHALGEARWGVARGAASCLCVGAGTGLGGGFVLDGQVVLGFHGAAGHIGHTLHPAASGVLCACGAPAHCETVTSGTAIAARYQGKSILDELDESAMGAEIARRADGGDLAALSVVEAAGRALGEALGGWCNVLDPEIVVLSGSVTGAGHAWRRALDEGFKSQVLPPIADVPILCAALGADAPLVGAAEFARRSR